METRFLFTFMVICAPVCLSLGSTQLPSQVAPVSTLLQVQRTRAERMAQPSVKSPQQAASTSSTRKCFIRFVRVIGRESNYVWVCLCEGEAGASDKADGRVQFDLTPGVNDGNAQNIATLRCIERFRPRMFKVCNKDPQRFQRHAAPILHRCAREKPTAEEKKKDGPFIYSRDDCSAKFFRETLPKKGGSWVCRCIQNPTYSVVTGRAEILTDAAPIDPLQEALIIDSCTVGVREQVDRVCKFTPSDFELLGLHLLQVCCKRARTKSDTKFQCASVVPDNVAPLKVPV